MTTPRITDEQMFRAVDAIAETRRQLSDAEDARERRPLPEWEVTVEYRAHQFFPDAPEFHTVDGIHARDAETAEEFACAVVRALEGVTVSEIIDAKAVRAMEGI